MKSNIKFNINKIITIIKKFNNNFNTNEFLENLYHINNLIYKLYRISTLNIKKNKKIKLIMKLQNPNKKTFLSKKQSIFIYNNFLGKINYLYVNILNLRKKHMHNIIAHNNTKIFNNFFNLIFFPLWSLENTPIFGNVVEQQLDIIGIFLDYFDIIMEQLAPWYGLIMDIVLDLAQAVPGAGTVASGIALPMNFLEEPIEWLIANGADLIGFFINVSRKQWGLAYISALALSSNFADIMDAIITNMTVINKYLKRNNNNLSKIIDFNKRVSNYQPMLQIILQNPQIITKPEQFILKILVPYKKLFPYLNKLNDKKFKLFIKNILRLLKKIDDPYKYINTIEKIFKNLI